MEKITEQAIHELVSMPSSGPVVTMYVPIHSSSAPPHRAEDHIRLKNLIQNVSHELHQQHDTPQLAQVLRDWFETTALQNETHAHGMLICAYGDTVRTFQLPIDTEEYTAVDTTFHLAPIVGLLNDAQSFYVLAISQNHPQLLIGDMYGLSTTQIVLPESLTAALRIDENNQKSEQALSAGGSSMGTNAYNGRGGARDTHEDDHLRFLRLIDKAILAHADRSLPLVLAGTESEVAAYRSISKYPRILHGSINGSVVGAPREPVFLQSQQLVQQEVIDPLHQEAIATFERMRATATTRVADTADELQEAAAEGRIATLFIGMNSHTADTVQDSIEPQARLTFPTLAIKQLIHTVALAVHHTKGKIVMLDRHTLPGSLPVAAVLRY